MSNDARHSLYRVYKTSVQRVPLEIKSLNSSAAFLVLLDSERQVIIWIGAGCESADYELAKELAKGVMLKDYLEKEIEVPVIVEEAEPPQLLNAMLDVFWSKSTTYQSKSVAHQRKEKIQNSPVSVGVITRMSQVSTECEFKETSFAHPDSSGTVPRIAFAPIEKDTIAYVNVGDQWDVWVARGVNADVEAQVVDVLQKSILPTISEGSMAFQKEILSQYIQIVRQGDERFLFRRPLKIFTDFEPPGKTLPRPEALQLSSTAFAKAMEKEKLVKVSDKDEEEEEEEDEEENKEEKPVVSVEKQGDALDTAKAENGVEAPVSVSRGDGGDKSALVSSLLPSKERVVEEEKPTKNNVDKTGRSSSVRFSGADESSKPRLAGLGAGAGVAAKGASDFQVEDEVDDVDYADFNDPALLAHAISKANALPDEASPVHNSLSVITKDMVSIVEAENVNVAARNDLINESARNPATLLGWQVEVDEGVYAGIFVVGAVRKTPITRKSQFLLRGLNGDEFWIRLQRGAKKRGIPFRPLRKIKVEFDPLSSGSVDSFEEDEEERALE